jgi:hypothetical protein
MVVDCREYRPELSMIHEFELAFRGESGQPLFAGECSTSTADNAMLQRARHQCDQASYSS